MNIYQKYYPVNPTNKFQQLNNPQSNVQSLQIPNIPYLTPLTVTKVLLIIGVSYLAYKYAWVPFSIESEKRSCIDACYKKAEKKEEK